MKNKLFLLLILLFTGCSSDYNKELVVEYKQIMIPSALLKTIKNPELPKEMKEEEISKYVLVLYKNNKIHKSNIRQIKRIFEEYEKQSTMK